MGEELKLVGRLSHNRYVSNDKLVSKSTFTVLKRKSGLTLNDIDIDIDNDIDMLELPSKPEGLYEIVTVGFYGCFDDDYELKLIPYKE